jgi:hypothetical protein
MPPLLLKTRIPQDCSLCTALTSFLISSCRSWPLVDGLEILKKDYELLVNVMHNAYGGNSACPFCSSYQLLFQVLDANPALFPQRWGQGPGHPRWDKVKTLLLFLIKTGCSSAMYLPIRLNFGRKPKHEISMFLTR